MKRTWVGMALWVAMAGGAQGVIVTNTVERQVPRYQAIAQLSADCATAVLMATIDFNPVVPPGAVIKSSELKGDVDDALKINGDHLVNWDVCGPASFDVDIMDDIDPATGCFSIDVYDKTSSGITDNEVLLNAYNTLTYEITDPPNAGGDEDDGGNYPENEFCRTGTCENAYQIVCWTDSAGCKGCRSHGSPQVSFGVANLDVRVNDIPVWHDTAVGPALELEMRFGNYASTNNGVFGPKWSCNWESSVTVLDALTNRIVFPSGSRCNLVWDGANNRYAPPDALDGYLVAISNGYEYRRSDGGVLSYGTSGGTNVYLLSGVRDAWSNAVAVTYSGGRLAAVEQVSPATGRKLEFHYGGSGLATSVVTEASAQTAATFSYLPSGLLGGVVDMGGFAYSYAYTNGYLARVMKGEAQRMGVAYSSTPGLWTNASCHWVQMEDAGGFTSKYTWEYGVIRQEISRSGQSSTQENFYAVTMAGSRGRVLQGIMEAGSMQSYQYNAQGRVTNRTDRSGGVWRQAYNSKNKLTQVTDPEGRTTVRVYDANGVDLLYETPPEGPVQRYASYVPDRHVVAAESNALGQATTYGYNALGLVTNIHDGRATQAFSYNAEGRLTARHLNGILQETNRYDAFGRREWTRDAVGLEVSFTYDGLNRLTSQVFQNGSQVSVQSNVYGCCFLESATDRRGNAWNYTYNDIGEKQFETNPKNLTTAYAYGLAGKPISISNALEWTSREYADAGWLKTVVYPTNRAYDTAYHAENYWYDAEGRQIKRQAVSGAFYRDEHDALGRLTATYVPDGSTSAYGVEKYIQAESNRYDGLGRRIWTRDIRGLEVSNTYDAVGQLTGKAYPDGSTEAWTYNLWGEMTSAKDRAGNVVSNVYDGFGHVVRRIDARGGQVGYGYSDAGLMVALTNALGQVWRFEYDAEGRVVQTTHPDDTTECHAYDPLGNVTQSVKGGVTTTYSYDELGNRTSVVVDGHAVETATYDGLGRLLSSVNADGLSISNTWNSWGQADARTWPGGASEAYRYGDRGLTNTIDRLGILVRQQRDTLGRLTNQIDGATNSICYAYWSNGVDQLRYLWDGNGNQTSWDFDAFGNMTNKAYADGTADRYQYDRLNRVTNQLDAAGIATRYAYDAKGNPLTMAPGSDPQVSYAYDALDRRTNMADGVGSTRWTYDAMGRLASETGPFGTTVSAGYDAFGRMTNISFSGRTWSYQYDAMGRVTNLVAPEGTYRFGHLEEGFRKTSISYPNGVEAALTYDGWTRLTNLVYSSGGSNRLSIAYVYDADDRRTSETWDSGRSMAYAYDGAHQLTDASSASRASDNAAYRYDAAGNPLRRTESELGVTNGFNNLNQIVSGVWTGGAVTVAGAVNYNAGTVTVNGAVAERHGLFYERSGVSLSEGTNILTAVYHGPAFTNTAMVATSIAEVVVGATAYGHDANGNLTSDANFAYQYDVQNRLTNVVRKADGVSTLANRYDGTGRRVEAVRETGTERYVYFPGSFLVLAVLDGSNNVKEVFTHGPDLSGSLGGAGGIGGILAQTTGAAGPGTHYLHPDAMGNVVMTTDASGQTSSTVHYGPFGRILARSGEFQSRYLFSSKEWEAAAGLNYYGYRFYSPSLGRWISRDPIEEAGGANIYVFVANNSLSLFDPLGLDWKTILGPERHLLSGGDHPYSHYEEYVVRFFGPLKNIFADTFSQQTLNKLGVYSYSYPNGNPGVWNGSYTLRLDKDDDQGLCRVYITYQIKPYKAPYPPKGDADYKDEKTEYFENSCPCNIFK